MTYSRYLWIGALLVITAACSNQPLNTAAPETLPVDPTVQSTVILELVSPTLTGATTQPPVPLTDTLTPPPTETVLPSDTGVPENGSIMGEHIIRSGETLSCIGRGYGVLPQAIAETNGIQLTTILHVGQALKIPAVQWIGIPAGPVCLTQFASPFPGLPVTGPISPGLNTPISTLPNLPLSPIPATPIDTPILALTNTPTLQIPPTETPHCVVDRSGELHCF